jgi:hypothetical protein
MENPILDMLEDLIGYPIDKSENSLNRYRVDNFIYTIQILPDRSPVLYDIEYMVKRYRYKKLKANSQRLQTI